MTEKHQQPDLSSWQGLTLTPTNPPNAGGFQLCNRNTVTLTSHFSGLNFISSNIARDECLYGTRKFLKEQVKEDNFSCPTVQLILLKYLLLQNFGENGSDFITFGVNGN